MSNNEDGQKLSIFKELPKGFSPNRFVGELVVEVAKGQFARQLVVCKDGIDQLDSSGTPVRSEQIIWVSSSFKI